MKKRMYITIAIVAVILLIVSVLYKPMLAFFTSRDQQSNQFSIGNISASITEPNYEDSQILVPGAEIVKDPTFSNTGKVNSYIRAQVYVPISTEIKYVDANEQVITPTSEIELISYQINAGWEKVETDGFTGIYEDSQGNKYQVYTYKYMENGQEKITIPGETINTPVFSKIKIINYLDIDETKQLKIHVTALAVQAEGGTADEMWSYYKNQNGTAIMGVE